MTENGSNTFNLGSTIPIKFALCDFNGIKVDSSISKLYLLNTDDIASNRIKACSTANANIDNLFRYSDSQYIFNLSTRDLKNGTWELIVVLDDGTEKAFTIVLK